MQCLTLKLIDYLSSHAFGVSFSTFCYANISQLFLSLNILSPTAELALKMTAIIAFFTAILTFMIQLMKFLDDAFERYNRFFKRKK